MRNLFVLLLCCLSVNSFSQKVICSNIDTDSLTLNEEFGEYTSKNKEGFDPEYLGQCQKLFHDLIYLITSESVSNDTTTMLSSTLYVSGKGKVLGLHYELSDGNLQITKEQHQKIKEKFINYLEDFEFNLPQKKNWYSFQIQEIPPLQKMRFYRDYLKPNPEPTAAANTKLGLIQRLGNQCTEIWQKEGTRNPGELKFLGLLNVCLYTLDNDNPMYKSLRQIAKEESTDVLHAQIFKYMYASCPIVRAKYGLYNQQFPIYKEYAQRVCDCLPNTYQKMKGNDPDVDDDIFYAANDTCKGEAIELMRDRFIAMRDSIWDDAKKKNIEPKVATNVFLSGVDGTVPFNCPYVLDRWENNFVGFMKADSMRNLHWSVKRKELTLRPLEALINNNLKTLETYYFSKEAYQKNQSEIKRIKEELDRMMKKAGKGNFNFGLVGQRKENGEYVEELTVLNTSSLERYFQIRVHFNKSEGAEKIMRLEFVTKDKIRMSFQTESDVIKQ
jgi:hypothetical protein